MIARGAVRRRIAARHAVLARHVAVKLLRPGLAKDPYFLRRFAAEVRVPRLVRHPGCVAIIDHGVCETSGPFLVMEYVGGATLRSIVAAEGPLSLRRVIGIVDQILAVLEDAHAAGIVHADMKSDNILVAATGSGADRVKVIDFGLARQRDDDDDERAEEGDTISCTPEYLAPEVIRGRSATAAADLYAVGIMLYELLTGGTPFAGGPSVRVLERAPARLGGAALPAAARPPDPVRPRPGGRARARQGSRAALCRCRRVPRRPSPVRGPRRGPGFLRAFGSLGRQAVHDPAPRARLRPRARSARSGPGPRGNDPRPRPAADSALLLTLVHGLHPHMSEAES